MCLAWMEMVRRGTHDSDELLMVVELLSVGAGRRFRRSSESATTNGGRPVSDGGPVI